jgi:hypothetical protein
MPGNWTTPTDTITLNTWYHVCAVRDSSLAANVPVIYVDAVAQTLTEVVTQVGATADETGSKLLLGNTKTTSADYNYPFFGKMRDVRIYNRLLTPAEVTSIKNAGVGGVTVTSGLVFQALCVPTAQVAHYTDLTLTSDDKILDNIQGIVGTMHGAPTIRTI